MAEEARVNRLTAYSKFLSTSRIRSPSSNESRDVILSPIWLQSPSVNRQSELPMTSGIDPFVREGDRSSGLLPRIESRAPGREGEAAPGVQAYNFRFCLTEVPSNRVPIERPANYDPLQYELLLRSLRCSDPARFQGSHRYIGVHRRNRSAAAVSSIE